MLDRFMYNNWAFFSYSNSARNFVYLCIIFFCLGFVSASPWLQNIKLMDFVLFFLTFQFIIILFYKWHGPEALSKLGLHTLSGCEFCCEFWFALLLSFAYADHANDWTALIYAPCCASLSYLLKTFRQW